MAHNYKFRNCLFATIIAGLSASIAFSQARPAVPESIKPVRVIQRSDGIYFVDFGSDAFAQLRLDSPKLASMNAGKKITVRLGEKLTTADHLDAKPGGAIRYLESVLTTETGKNVYRPQLPQKDARWMPVDIGPVMPFRYEE